MTAQPITLMINAGLAVDLPHIEETGAAGVGLFRTELQFMVAATFPRAAEQFSLYRAVLDAAGERPVTFRTLDIGGDKVLPYMRNVVEENPALGWRAIRLGLDRPALLRSQIRALLRAAAGRGLKIMFPMIAAVEEFDEAKALVERELTHLRRHGHKLPERVDVGSMVEVPSLLYQLDELLDARGFPLGRLERSGAVLLCGRSRQCPGRRPLRSDLGAGAARAAARSPPRASRTTSRSRSAASWRRGRSARWPWSRSATARSRSRPRRSARSRPCCSISISPRSPALVEPLLESPAGGVSVRDQLKEFAAAQGLAL